MLVENILKLKPRIDIRSGSFVKLVKNTVVGSYPSCYMPIPKPDNIVMGDNNSGSEDDNSGSEDDNSGSEDESPELQKEYPRSSFNLNNYLRNRESNLTEKRAVNLDYASRHLLTQDMLRETRIPLPGYNTVFCSQWLSSKQIVFGTKCNKLLVYEVSKRRVDVIPLLSHGRYNYDDNQDGLYAIEINPSHTYLATRARVSTDVAVYRLPTFDPVCVGSNGHRNIIMDMCWLDDQFFVSGSDDSWIALWRINENHMDFPDGGQEACPTFANILPISVKDCGPAQRICSLCFNEDYKEIAVLTFQGYIHIFSAETFEQKLSRELSNRQDNVCLSYHHTGLYAVGCRLYTLLLDAKTLKTVNQITNSGCVTKSTSFQHNLLTIGTGLGMLTFYDLRAGKYLQSNVYGPSIVFLNASKGIVHREEDMDGLQQFKPGIYTHCYDSAGLRIFSAGGPISTDLIGSYAAIWQ